MAKIKHLKFKAGRFLDVFAEHPHLLRDFAQKFDNNRFLAEEDFTLDAFKQLVADAVKTDPPMVEHLYRAYDMSMNTYGHETICEVIKKMGLRVDDSLPVECLTIWLHNHDQDQFNFAYDRMSFNHLEKVSMFRIAPPHHFEAASEQVQAFENVLKEAFENDKGSSNVLVRSYEENDCLNLIVYHEKRTQAQLIFKDLKDAVGPLMLRPAKQDFISFNQKTGELQVDASYPKEKIALRKAFAKEFLQDATLFEAPDAARVFDLDVMAHSEFAMPVSDPEHSAILTELKFRLPSETNPTLTISSDNVLTTLKNTNQRISIAGASVASAKIRLCFGNQPRDKKIITLVGTNFISFNASTHKEEVETYLRQWGILLARESSQMAA